MRLEITIPDNTGPDLQAKIQKLTRQLSDNTELAEEIELDDDDAIQATFTPDRLAHIDNALGVVKAGNFFTAAEAEEHFAKKEASWLESHQLKVISSPFPLES